MAWQIAIVLDETTNLDSLKILNSQMPLWALYTPERKQGLVHLNQDLGNPWAPEPGFTVFDWLHCEDSVAKILSLVPTIEDHHPNLSTIRLFGVPPSDRLSIGLQGLGFSRIRSSAWDGVGFAKPFHALLKIPQLHLDAEGWKSSEDAYQAFFVALGAPPWHGRNLDALNDSIGTGGINAVEVPYRIVVHNTRHSNEQVSVFLRDFSGLIADLRGNGCPVDLVLEID